MDWSYEEGCLSIPGIRENILRKERVRIRFYDENFELREKWFDSVTGRIILHEYDHLEGKLFTDYLSPLRMQMIRNKLKSIKKGRVDVKYNMRFPVKKKVR